jgi:hypothetical protein
VNDVKSFVVVANYDDCDEICFDGMVEELDRMNQLNVFQYPIDTYLYGNERIKSFRVVFFGSYRNDHLVFDENVRYVVSMTTNYQIVLYIYLKRKRNVCDVMEERKKIREEKNFKFFSSSFLSFVD